MTELSMPVSLSIPLLILNVYNRESGLFDVAIESFKVMQNVTTLEFKTIIKLTVVQKYGHGASR